MGQAYDIAILGATPAGFAASHYLARHHRRVVLIDAPHAANECPLTDWVPRGFFELRGLPKSLAKACGAVSFSRVHYHNVRLEREVRYGTRKSVGQFVRYDALCKTLRSAAVDAGVKLRSSKTPPTIELGEDHVRLVGTTQVAAKLLMITYSRPHDVLMDLALPVRSVPRSQLVVAGLDVPVDAKGMGGFDNGLHVVELPERSELGLFFAMNGTAHLRVISSSTAAGTRAAELSEMVTGLQRAGILPSNLQRGRARGALWHPPAGVALELETHVAKRCLLVGTAGGFADSITGQTVRPTVESALLASDAALAALKSPNTQETLMKFKNAWREHLADYLRPPSTSLRLLLPLLFVNQNIVDRFTRALLYGENI